MWSVASKTGTPSASRLVQRVVQSLLEIQAVGHHEVRPVDRLEVLGRGCPVVRVAPLAMRTVTVARSPTRSLTTEPRTGVVTTMSRLSAVGGDLPSRPGRPRRGPGATKARPWRATPRRIDSTGTDIESHGSSSPAARAAAVQLEPVGLDLPAGAPLDVLQGKTDLLDLGDAAAARADDVMVVAGRLTGHVGVLAGGQVEALQHAQLSEEVQRAEDRGPADAQPARPRVADEVRGGEVAFACHDELRDSAARRGQPVAGPVERRHERFDARASMDRGTAAD